MYLKSLVSLAALTALSTAQYLGTSCDPVYNTTVCNSPTEIAVCDQNIWAHLTDCNSGTFCVNKMCIDENQPSSVDSTAETTSFSTTVMVPVACPFAKAYNPNDKYSDCTAYADWWQSFTEEEEPKSENYFTFTASMTSSESTSAGAGRWSGLGAKSVVAVVALGVSGILGAF